MIYGPFLLMTNTQRHSLLWVALLYAHDGEEALEIQNASLVLYQKLFLSSWGEANIRKN